MNTAIIVAAGSGTRFGGAIPKQFVEILGKPLIVHTLERFESCPAIDQIILVLSADQIGRFEEIARKYAFKKISGIIPGGRTRADSVRSGLNLVDANDAGIIAVHDGARPLVTSQEIIDTIEKAAKTGAACLVAKVTETIKEISGGRVVRTVDRNKLRRALTPQCFRFEILRNAYDLSDHATEATDDCFLVEQSGVPIAFVEGGLANIKVTTQEDLITAEMLLRNGLAGAADHQEADQ